MIGLCQTPELDPIRKISFSVDNIVPELSVQKIDKKYVFYGYFHLNAELSGYVWDSANWCP